MKIYFTASLRGKDELGKNYSQISELISEMGHTNLDTLFETADAETFYEGGHEEQMRLYKATMQKIKSADVVILEVSKHSLSMGFVMNQALDLGKSVIALYVKDRPPFFASGIDNDKLQVLEYSPQTLSTVLGSALDYAQETMDTRFNFFISPSLSHYLDWISQTKKIPRSVYLRQLIEEDRECHKKQYEAS
jgi:hypothetical protein